MLQNACTYKPCWFTKKGKIIKLKIYQILCPKTIILNFAYKTLPNISKSTKCCFHKLPCIIREEGSTYQPFIALPFQYYIDNRRTAGDFSDKSISIKISHSVYSKDVFDFMCNNISSSSKLLSTHKLQFRS